MDKLETFISLLKRVGIKGALEIEEKDPQYIAIKKLVKENKRTDRDEIAKLVVSNALVSYQLSMKGEQYWKTFSTFMSKKANIITFIKTYNKRLLEAKLRRIEKAKMLNISIEESCLSLYRKLTSIYGKQKTVSFAVKMFGYTKRAYGALELFPFSVEIPFDSRVEKITKALNLKKSSWDYIAKKTNIPPLHIDSIIWNAYPQQGRTPIDKEMAWLLWEKEK